MNVSSHGWGVTFKMVCRNYYRERFKKWREYNKNKKPHHNKKKVVNICWDGNMGKIPGADKNSLDSIEYKGRRIHLYGHLNANIGYGWKKGKAVYIDMIDAKFVIENYGTTIAYHFTTLEKLVQKVQILKEEAVVVVMPAPKPTIHHFDIEAYRNEPQYNFHEEKISGQ